MYSFHSTKDTFFEKWCVLGHWYGLFAFTWLLAVPD